MNEYDHVKIEIYSVSQRRGDIDAVIPLTWWIGAPAPVTENAVCMREQMVAEIMMAGGAL
jgi:hypothetical protein